ncbi:hypothetical protein VTO42DRAFT_7931 [Malbranchea cinnamomea]
MATKDEKNGSAPAAAAALNICVSSTTTVQDPVTLHPASHAVTSLGITTTTTTIGEVTSTMDVPTMALVSPVSPLVDYPGPRSRSQMIFAEKLITSIEASPENQGGSSGDMTASPATTPADSFISDPFFPSSRSSFTSNSSESAAPPKPLRSILKNGPKPREVVFEDGSEDGDDELGDDSESDTENDHDTDVDDNEEEEEEAESGAEDGEESENDEYDSEEGGDDDDWDDESDNEDLNAAFSFISFGNSVRFADEETVVFIEARPVEPSAQDTMTAHERMLLSQDSRRRPSLNGKDYDPDEHTRDVADLDQELLSAYINGLRTVNLEQCKTAIRARTVNLDPDDDDDDDGTSVPGETHTVMNEYLDRIVETVLGLFPHLFTEEEFSRILEQAELAIAIDESDDFAYRPQSAAIQRMLRGVLEEKLAVDTDFIGGVMTVWLAGELLEPLARLAHQRHR